MVPLSFIGAFTDHVNARELLAGGKDESCQLQGPHASAGAALISKAQEIETVLVPTIIAIIHKCGR